MPLNLSGIVNIQGDNMKNRRFANPKKLNSTVHKLRFIAGCALIGSVVAGAFFGWVEAPIDMRAVGVAIGTTAGLISNHLFA
ncbi:hypothetical protein KY495_11710 [Massilia sp. PAMC28688]|uniref:hypothetical protein n=1 Tax=Massilia sp. PAMC28688 TaxID=2861283 RepID=UPI001C62D50E|nr:hypothetical protein [Massilia sp. PAMC28688]QYF95756.1 hypothetical protein KY495_11710 [Massilia sp. PAMC28688]